MKLMGRWNWTLAAPAVGSPEERAAEPKEGR
jgi:hypothetical protein